MEYCLNLFSGRQFVDSNGAPYNGAKLFIYSAGSSTKVTTYKDNAGASQHANPIILNARGEPADGAGASQPIWQESGVSVKLVLAPANDTDPPVSAISTWDNIGGINDSSVIADQWIPGPTPTFVGTTSFTLVGDQVSTFHKGRRVKTTNSGGTIYSTITGSVYTTLTTVTVVNDSGVMDSGLSTVSYGLFSSTNSSAPSGVPYLWSTGDVKATFKSTADSGWVMMNDGSIGSASSGATTRANADTEALYTLLWTNILNAWAPVSTGRGASAAADFAANKTLTLPRSLGRALAVAGAGATLTSRALGQYLGAETHTLTTEEMPPHTHTYDRGYEVTGALYASGTNDAPLQNNASQNTGSAGSGSAHNNMPPEFFVNIMVKL